MPEWEVFVHIQASGYTDRQFASSCFCIAAAEQQFIFFLIQICTRFFPDIFVCEYLFAPVARIIVCSVVKMIADHRALVAASFAVKQAGGIVSFGDEVVQFCFSTLAGDGMKGASESSHEFRNVASGNFCICQNLQSAHHCIVSHLTS